MLEFKKSNVNTLKVEKVKEIERDIEDVSRDLKNLIRLGKQNINFEDLKSLFILSNKIIELDIIMSLENELDIAETTLSEYKSAIGEI